MVFMVLRLGIDRAEGGTMLGKGSEIERQFLIVGLKLRLLRRIYDIVMVLESCHIPLSSYPTP
jgi:hypothetical protein